VCPLSRQEPLDATDVINETGTVRLMNVIRV
jgi:hypothetical protein